MLNLFILAIPVACVSWTVTHEEIFREIREAWKAASEDRENCLIVRKVAYIFTCEYCFSHYVALLALHLAPTRLLVDSRSGSVLAWFALVWIANLYMSLHFWLRLGIRLTGAQAKNYERENW